MNFIAKLILFFFVSLVTEWILVGFMAVFKQWKAAWIIAQLAHILRGGVVLLWCAAVVKAKPMGSDSIDIRIQVG